MWINLKNIQWIKKIQKIHYNGCDETQNWLVNGFQNLWKWNIFWTFLHKPWHNSMDFFFKVLKHFFEYFCENIPRNIFPKVV
jgi:hypothetical protein